MNAHLEPLTLEAYVEHQLPDRQRQQVETHLMTCPACRASANRRARLAALAAQLPAELPEPTLARRIAAAIEAKRPARARQWRRVRAVAVASALVGLGLVAAAWPEAARAFERTLNVLESNAANLTADVLLVTPDAYTAALFNALLDWQGGLAEETGAALLLGVSLLSLAAFGGLGSLLKPAAPANGHSH